MHPPARPARLLAILAGAVVASLLLASVAEAHTPQKVGPYTLEIGWHVEPTYVGQPNAVEVTITDASDKPVLDLGADDLHVVVSTNGQDSPSLSFEPAFDTVEMEGALGQYNASIVPTAPGDYTFHITGAIHGTKVDVSLSSGAETFDPVKESTDLEFPAKLPSLAEVTTRLDRIDARIAALQSAQPATSSGDPIAEVRAAASDAQASADRALWAGIAIGGLGLVVGAIALAMAARSGRRGAGAA